MREETQKAFNNILDCMTGSDGAVRFIYFNDLIKELDTRASNGDEAAEELILLVHRFSKRIDIANNSKIQWSMKK